ncbi:MULTISPECIES: Holliday junction resolvase RuvX [unclassified Apibacter]|uniref:Holliday junction resolvase RuvX n=1 Tax=unclassified Apibacter TaxID=2630820 RepID=UPI0013213C67|nr:MULTISPECIES: Holliday junction resolvase RuvX [unclassified Apibacter]MCX8676351.1 Holliday junction resolvase RuvX [Apibacter sp. B3919]MXO23816.1 Holliday junction resolvase RuvX [Apibacter sp. B3924]MXO26506.1 Holliday junction resolvase RuvX [Apibacter sp. B3813]MXO28458.1 Holliday junction resolvase RuvX [Apibacter sp. B3913]MXO30412.1 Holliday junction resolvase RuvX [Apibacter sp. B3912]
MSKILAIDYGEKRSGLAETDDMQIVASGLAGIMTSNLIPFLEKYMAENSVEKIIIGLPVRLNGELSDVEISIQKLIKKITSLFPNIPVERVDERFTSKIASHFISLSGKNKKNRENKHLLDEVSATLILQTYLEKK